MDSSSIRAWKVYENKAVQMQAYIYSQTCFKQAPMGKPIIGCLTQVLLNTGRFPLLCLEWDLK